MTKTNSKYLDYDIESGEHRDAEAEWPTHNAQTKEFMEWHYWTCVMEGSNGDRFFFFFCDFNMTGEVNKGDIRAFHPDFKAP